MIFPKREDDSCLHDRWLEIIIAGVRDSLVSPAIVYFGITRTYANVQSRYAKENGSKSRGGWVNGNNAMRRLASHGVINYR